MSMNIVVVCGSVRQNRRTILPSRYINTKLSQMGHESVLVDFTELPLQFVNSDPTPSNLHKQYPDENVQKWSGIADAADGFVLVTPEYNHSYSAVLKNALDWLYPEFNDKPALLVGVSNGLNGGLRAIEALRPVAANFALYDLQGAVIVRQVQNAFDADGMILDEKLAGQIEKSLQTLVKTAEVMRPLRAASANS